MIRSLSIDEALFVHARLIEHSGGSLGLRDRGALESALAQPAASFGGQLLYPDVVDRAAALGHALISNHPFIDGNKRVGHAAMALYLRLHNLRLSQSIDGQEDVVMRLASGTMARDDLRDWVTSHVVPLRG